MCLTVAVTAAVTVRVIVCVWGGLWLCAYWGVTEAVRMCVCVCVIHPHAVQSVLRAFVDRPPQYVPSWPAGAPLSAIMSILMCASVCICARACVSWDVYGQDIVYVCE